MKIGFIGAGHVGTAFGYYLKSKGYKLCGYFSKTFESAQKSAKITESNAFITAKDLLDNIDILFITTTDSQIQPVCDALACENLFRPRQVIVHMSGALSSEALNSAKEKGCYTFSLHPIQAFAYLDSSEFDLSDTVFSIEGDFKSTDVLEKMLGQTGNSFFKINADQKVLYHAAACIFSNYLTTLMEEGLDFFKAIGISKDDSLKAVLPLIRGTIDNIELLGTEKALTGPIARGDSDTVKQHLEHINRTLPEKLELYLLLAVSTLALAKQYKLNDSDKADALSDLIHEYLATVQKAKEGGTHD